MSDQSNILLRYSVALIRRTPLLVLSALCAAGASAAPTPWATFKGYYVGMSRTQAKAVGLGECGYGDKGVGLYKDDIYCALPSSKLAIGSLVVHKARLRFAAPKHETVVDLLLEVHATKSAVVSALTEVYGKPYGDQRTWTWQRDTDHEILVSKRSSDGNVSVRFTVTPGLSKAIKQRANSERARSQKLQDF